MMKVFEGLTLSYYSITDEIKGKQIDFNLLPNETEKRVMMEARPSYPSNKLTFTIANITKQKSIRSFNIWLRMNGQFDGDVVLEDSKRNFLNSLIYLIAHSYSALLISNVQMIGVHTKHVLVLLRDCSILTRIVSRVVRFILKEMKKA